ncbi:hypothetical protein L7F22_026733 [Adiantum nelumboides]|nr:hypothetical protein [Adiantum nelumboides]
MGDDEGDSEESEEDDDEDDDEEDSEEDEDEDEDGERSTSLGAEEKKKGTDKESLVNPNSIYSTPMEGIQMTNQGSSTDPSSSIPGSTASPLKRNVEGGMMTDGGSASEATGAENAVDENGQPIVKKKKKGKPRPITTPTPPPEPPKPRPTVRLSLNLNSSLRQAQISRNDWADWWATQQRIQADLKEGGTGLAAVTPNGINGTQTNGNAEAGPSNPPASGQASAALSDGLTAEERAFLLRHQEGPPAKKRRKRRNDVDGQYDVTDPFVDDSELLLDEPTHVGKTATKGFYVCSGDVEVETVKKPEREEPMLEFQEEV